MPNMDDQAEGGDDAQVLQDPPLARLLFQSSAPMVVCIWLVVRLWLGIRWIVLGWTTFADPTQPDLLAAAAAVAHIAFGIALVIGAFVGIAATAGVIENVVAFAVPGGADGDPLEMIAAALLILAWKNAGYLGADRYLLRFFGAPWWDTQVPHVPRSARR
jgi:uncharacterized membrane protein YphA (DoxX/SURF4 family)